VHAVLAFGWLSAHLSRHSIGERHLLGAAPNPRNHMDKKRACIFRPRLSTIAASHVEVQFNPRIGCFLRWVVGDFFRDEANSGRAGPLAGSKFGVREGKVEFIDSVMSALARWLSRPCAGRLIANPAPSHAVASRPKGRQFHRTSLSPWEPKPGGFLSRLWAWAEAEGGSGTTRKSTPTSSGIGTAQGRRFHDAKTGGLPARPRYRASRDQKLGRAALS